MKDSPSNKENSFSQDTLDAMPSFVFIANCSGVVTTWNKKFNDFFSVEKGEEGKDKEVLKLVFPDQDTRRKVKQVIKEVCSGITKSEDWTSVCKNKNGKEHHIFWITKAVMSGTTIQVFAVGTDITSLKKIEKQETENRIWLEALANSSMVFLGMATQENSYHYIGLQLEKFVKGCLFVVSSIGENEEFFSIEGVYGLESNKWQLLLDTLGWNPVGRRFNITDEMYDFIGSGNLKKTDEGLYELTDGVVSSVAARNIERSFGVDNIYTMLIEGQNKPLGGVLVLASEKVTNIDLRIVEGVINQSAIAIERNIKDKKLVIEKEKAQETDRLKSTFMENLSHEIRTPMNAILGFSQLLGLPNLDKKKRRLYVDIINNKGRMLLKLVNDIIDASKVDAGQLTLVHQPFRLNTLLRDLKTFFDKEKVFQQREAITIDLILPDNTDDMDVVSDEGRLEQILTNLLSNALKYTDKGMIELGYIPKDKAIEFFVSDTGIGIHPSMQDLIFDRYRQISREDFRSQTGTGLGLSISKGLVELLGGKIWVESSPGKGANFRFEIPVEESLSKLVSVPYIVSDTDILTPNWKNKVLLIAEDEEANYLYVNELLEPTGVKLLWVQDGSQAVELVSTIKNVDAILMDIKMPVKDGYAATLEIRQLNPSIPIIAQTAYALTEDRQKAEAAGCDDYITKPINSKQLFEILDKYLG